MQFVIEKGIPLPPPKQQGVGQTLELMDIGDSVLDERGVKCPVGTWFTAARKKNMAIACRKNSDGTYRIWRTA